MRMSIRTRLFVGVTALIVFFVMSSWFLNSQFLGKYYISQKKEGLLKNKERIEELFKNNPDQLFYTLEDIERNAGMKIYFIGEDYELRYHSSFRIFVGGFRIPIPFFQQVQPQLVYLDRGNSFFDIATDPRLQADFLILVSRFSTGEVLMLTTPIAAIHESTFIANKFFLFTGLLTIIVGGIIVFIFANRFTKPILELNDIAQKMSKLDFSKKYLCKTEDEIGELGSSINSLSDQLDSAISELKEANSKLMADIERERKIDEMRKEFISNVSHELKTPIALVQG